LDIVDAVPHRTEGEAVLLEHVPTDAKRVLDLGTGNGRLLKMIKANRPTIRGIGLDISPTMLMVAQESFAMDKDKSLKVIEHDLNNYGGSFIFNACQCLCDIRAIYYTMF